jgi:hypothetical protein
MSSLRAVVVALAATSSGALLKLPHASPSWSVTLKPVLH